MLVPFEEGWRVGSWLRSGDLIRVVRTRGHQQHGKQLIFVRDLSLLFPRLSDTYYHIWKPNFYLFTTWLL